MLEYVSNWVLKINMNVTPGPEAIFKLVLGNLRRFLRLCNRAADLLHPSIEPDLFNINLVIKQAELIQNV